MVARFFAASKAQQIGVGAHRAQRHDDVPRLERPGRRLRKHRREEHEVLGADDRRAPLLEIARDVAAGEAAAEDERAAARFPIHRSSIAGWRCR